MTAARSMDEVYYKRGDVIIQQDDIGDSFRPRRRVSQRHTHTKLS